MKNLEPRYGEPLCMLQNCDYKLEFCAYVNIERSL